VAQDGSRRRPDRPGDSEPAVAGEIRLKHRLRRFRGCFRPAARRAAAGAVDGDGGHFDDQPAHFEGRDAGEHAGTGRPGLASSLEEQNIFPDLAVEMLEVGESTGALPAMLNSVAEFTKKMCRRL